MLTDTITPSITMTSAAIKRVHALLQAPENQACALRIYIVGGGCSGFQYGFALDKQTNPDDRVLNHSLDPVETMPTAIQVTTLIDCMSMQYLQGAELDYEEKLQGARFVVKNPHAKTTCGCGSSFAIE